MELCKFCGQELVDGMCPSGHSFKKMCLNCEFLSKNENGELVCANEENRSREMKAILEAASGVTKMYQVESVEISPIPLKKPTAKCGQWKLDESVLEEIRNMFV